MARPTDIPEGRNYERAEESARSLDEARVAAEEEFFNSPWARQEAQRADFERAEGWKALTNDVRTGTTTLLIWILWIFIVVAALVALWIGFLVVVHFTYPSAGWLTEGELAALGALYTNAAPIIAPVALMSNAWIIAIFSFRRWVFRGRPSEDDGGR